MPAEAILDASAVLAFLGGEPGADRVGEVLAGARISAVNYGEIVGKLAERGAAQEDIRDILGPLDLIVAPFTEEQAWIAGGMRVATRPQGLSMADRACLALAEERGGAAYTTDRRWAAAGLSVAVEIVR